MLCLPSGNASDCFHNFATFWHAPIETVNQSMIERLGSSLGIEGWSDPNLVVLDYCAVELEKRAREKSESEAGRCWSFGNPGDAFDMDEATDVESYNLQVSRILETLGGSGAGRRAIITAIAEKQGISDSDELERMFSGESDVKL